ncbi:MAG TPA: cupredoxin domain-containing protein [Solirubrobacteraceae bacterium]|jgi:plastocyanin|nr:cupredoxin domain-containing protein [Solirubrobacteraceae bacterium]
MRIASRAVCLAVSIALLGGGAGAVASGSGTRARSGAAAHKRRCAALLHAKTHIGSGAARSTRAVMWSAAWAWGWGWKSGPYFGDSSERAGKSARRCAQGKHKAPARHGITTSTPTTGPAGTTPTGSGTPGAPVETTTPAGETPASTGETTGAPPEVTHIQVTSVEYHYTLSKATVPAGKVAFDFVNNGQDEHNLNVLSGEGSLTGSFPDTVSKGVRDQTIEMRPGTYTLFCSLPEHEAKGMKATLTVQ